MRVVIEMEIEQGKKTASELDHCPKVKINIFYNPCY